MKKPDQHKYFKLTLPTHPFFKPLFFQGDLKKKNIRSHNYQRFISLTCRRYSALTCSRRVMDETLNAGN